VILVPKVFHRVWIGPASMPDEFKRYGDTWLRHHPTWELKLWTPENFSTLYPELIAKCDKPSNASNIYRYEILREYGGVYIDTDFECLKNIEPLIDGEELFTAHQVDDPRNPGYYAPGFFGCTPSHPSMSALLVKAQRWTGPTYGPTLFTSVMRNFLPRVLSKRLFYPYSWDELERRNDVFPGAYAVHHWGSRTQSFSGRRTLRGPAT
jgi:mannosyltransferase OCH1-like enzyme